MHARYVTAVCYARCSARRGTVLSRDEPEKRRMRTYALLPRRVCRRRVARARRIRLDAVRAHDVERVYARRRCLCAPPSALAYAPSYVAAMSDAKRRRYAEVRCYARATQYDTRNTDVRALSRRS